MIGTFHLASGPHPLESYALYGEGWHLRVDNAIRVTLQPARSSVRAASRPDRCSTAETTA